MSTSRKQLTRFQRASALVPLALLSAASTLSLLQPVSSASADLEHGSGKLPDGTSVPEQAIKAPASVSNPGEIAPGVPPGSESRIIKGASANGIPSAALSAYQRAAQVIDTADKSCHADWTLIAAIGRVESNHGRYGGNTLDANAVSRPGIYGIPLNGRNGTATIADTDGGQYDHDKQFDRAMGPMQFIPSTWSVVGVDGDGDGKRNPQDLDDAALATAVYLCSGSEDLSATKGQRSAVYRYNHSNAYVNLVLSIMQAYARGDYASVPTSSAGTTTFSPDYGDSVFASGTKGYHYKGGGGFAHAYHTGGVKGVPASGKGGSTAGGTGGTTTGGSTGGGVTGSLPGGSGSGSGSGTGSGGNGGAGGVVGGVTGAVGGVVGGVTGGSGSGGSGGSGGSSGGSSPKPSPTPPPPTLTYAEAKAKCLASGISALDVAKLTACINNLLK